MPILSIDVTTTNATWTTVGSIAVPAGDFIIMTAGFFAERLDGPGLYGSRIRFLAWDNNGTLDSDSNVSEIGISQLDSRVVVNGSNIDIQVKGRVNQTWKWLAGQIYYTFGSL